MSTLIIVPCGSRKIWSRQPYKGPTKSCDVYTSGLFRLHKEYAKLFDGWMILSAKYGFISPTFVIPCDYNVSFNDPDTHPVSIKRLRKQVAKLKLNRYSHILILGGTNYCKMCQSAFKGTKCHLSFPFAGLPIGKMMQAVKQASADKYQRSGDWI